MNTSISSTLMQLADTCHNELIKEGSKSPCSPESMKSASPNDMQKLMAINLNFTAPSVPLVHSAASAPTLSRKVAHPSLSPKSEKSFSNNTLHSEKTCVSCGTKSTPLWRRSPEGQPVCNACGLYLKSNNTERPNWLKKRLEENRVSNNIARSDSADPSVITTKCFNCHVTSTPLWRRDPEGRLNCNACGLYFKLHNQPRPLDIAKRPLQRKSKTPSSQSSFESYRAPDYATSQQRQWQYPATLNGHRHSYPGSVHQRMLPPLSSLLMKGPVARGGVSKKSFNLAPVKYTPQRSLSLASGSLEAPSATNSVPLVNRRPSLDSSEQETLSEQTMTKKAPLPSIHSMLNPAIESPSSQTLQFARPSLPSFRLF